MQSRSRREVITGLIGPNGSTDGSQSFNIASLVVHARPVELGSICEVLAQMPGVEIHGKTAAGKIIITVETGTDHEVVQRMGAIGELPGVLSTALVFHHSDPTQPE